MSFCHSYGNVIPGHSCRSLLQPCYLCRLFNNSVFQWVAWYWELQLLSLAKRNKKASTSRAFSHENRTMEDTLLIVWKFFVFIFVCTPYHKTIEMRLYLVHCVATPAPPTILVRSELWIIVHIKENQYGHDEMLVVKDKYNHCLMNTL